LTDFVIADLVWVHLFCFNANLIKKATVKSVAFCKLFIKF